MLFYSYLHNFNFHDNILTETNYSLLKAILGISLLLTSFPP